MGFIYKNNALNQIIWINVFVFLILRLLIKIEYITPNDPISGESFYFLASSTNIDMILKNPWTLLTQMFTHINPGHICANMFVLYVFGTIFLKYLNNKKIISVYLLGGICSFIFLIIFDDSKSWNYGASGATYAIMFATTAFTPNYSFKIYNTNLLIKIKYFTILLIIVPIIIDPKNIQAHITHLGGGSYGLLYIYLLKKPENMLNKIAAFFSLIFSKKNTKKVVIENDYDYNARKKNEEKKLNQVLDKISKSGYSSLSKKEKEILEKDN